ncbi:protease modulator HflC [Paenibacillus thermoaerophilus]|uniref:Protein HflC n=1 Tax=Paenibacillus thermoaerophilus TaxID=1215385 RepID=A0ABW2V531_9BACL|nr:protease modulator HflC [Paenibacillus thermoaerophilus]TMV17953.1 protease modulator HflC [Paenibacillus thermoaerophilus]
MKTAKTKIALGLAAVAAAILLLASVYVVKENEYKVVLKFGEAVRINGDPGLAFKIPFIETTMSLPKYQMIYDSKPASILTLDKKPIEVDNYTVWRIADARQFLRTAKTLGNGEQRIDAAVYNAVRRKLSETNYGDIISENTQRGNLNDEITKEVKDVLERDNYGIEIIDVRIKRTDLPQENKESVYKRMISDRHAIATKYLSEGDEESKKIRARADRQAVELKAEAEAKAKEIIAQGEQEAAAIYNEAYSKDPAFYNMYRTLESYATTLKGEPVIMLPIDSPYTKLLLGSE